MFQNVMLSPRICDLFPKEQVHQNILSKSWSSWRPNSADNFEFSAELGLSTWKLSILQCVRNKGQYVLKESCIKAPNHLFMFLVSDLLAFCFRMITHLCREILSSQFTHFTRNVFETEKRNPQTFSLLECMHQNRCYSTSLLYLSTLMFQNVML